MWKKKKEACKADQSVMQGPVNVSQWKLEYSQKTKTDLGNNTVVTKARVIRVTPNIFYRVFQIKEQSVFSMQSVIQFIP